MWESFLLEILFVRVSSFEIQASDDIMIPPVSLPLLQFELLNLLTTPIKVQVISLQRKLVENVFNLVLLLIEETCPSRTRPVAQINDTTEATNCTRLDHGLASVVRM